MKAWFVLLFPAFLAACAAPMVAPVDERLFNDHLFAKPSERIRAEDVFAFSAAMKRFLDSDTAGSLHTKGNHRALIDALYSKDQLKLEFDSEVTRNAAQAFDARSGNCLSLVIMTAAFAKEMGLPVSFQSVDFDETWNRSGDLYLSIGHVNLTLGKRQTDRILGSSDAELTIDFLPQKDLRGQHARAIAERTIVAMYMNNRAVESLARGQLNDAYWWAREAIRQDPVFLSSYNTLGVIYRRNGNPREAERVLSFGIDRNPVNTQLMSNLIRVLRDLGRVAEAEALKRRLDLVQPNPPFFFYERGLAALRDGDFKTARDLFVKEIDHAANFHEVHFWLAVAYINLGEAEPARRQLAIAMEMSTTRNDRDLYAAKLERIRTYGTK